MKHLIITGFDPFGGETVNPAWEAVRRLPDTLGGYRLTKLMIPTRFGTAAETVLAAAETDPADVIVCVGQAGGRSAVTPERIAVNLMDARIPDNAGAAPKDQPCIPGGPDGLFSTLPVRAMTDAITAAGVPGQLSLSAGSFVCNDTLYRLLYHYRDSATRVGFVHVPFLPSQSKDTVPSLELGQMVQALSAVICALDK